MISRNVLLQDIKNLPPRIPNLSLSFDMWIRIKSKSFKSINANQVRSINLLSDIFNFRPTRSRIRNNIQNANTMQPISFSLWNVLLEFIQIDWQKIQSISMFSNVRIAYLVYIYTVHCSHREQRAFIFVFRIVLQFSGVQSFELCTKPNLNINCVSVCVYLFLVGIEHVRNGGKKVVWSIATTVAPISILSMRKHWSEHKSRKKTMYVRW